MTPAAGPLRVLVTGFGPFPGVSSNPSATLVGMLAKATPIAGVNLSTAIIPVAWARAKAVTLDAIGSARPQAILHFGVSKRASGFGIETQAYNECCATEDYEGQRAPAKKLSPSGKTALRTSLPTLALLGGLQAAGLPAAISHDAGRYLCNAVYYWSLDASLAGGYRALFVHVPAIGGEAACASALSMQRVLEGAIILIRGCAAAMLEAADLSMHEIASVCRSLR